ncbi:MAG: hypothetical protein KKD39_08000 [Candidatus Altiarchaeota archaeon]|nr:hypothetical protein [Candidatus Altiarchaeota archaeon]
MYTTRKTAAVSQAANVLPDQLEFQSLRYKKVGGARDEEIFVFEDMQELSGFLDPKNWSRIHRLSKGRSFTATAKVGDAEKAIKVRRVRGEDDIVYQSFSESFPKPAAFENIRRARFLYEKLRYEDDSIVVTAETPLGVVKSRDYGDVEVYLLPKETTHLHRLDGKDRQDAEAALGRYWELCENLDGHRVCEHDMVDVEQNIYFGRDRRGRMVLVKTDSEFTEIFSIRKLDRDIADVESMLSTVGFDSARYEGAGVYKSLRGHLVAERLVGATKLMSEEEKRGFLSADVAGKLVKAVESCAFGKRDEPRVDFMNMLTTILSESSQIAPNQRAEYVAEISDALTSCGKSERDYIVLSGRIRKNYRNIRPPAGEKDGMLWGI